MKKTPCVEADRLAALLQDESSGEDAQLFAHLETCAHCCQTLTDLAAERSLREELAHKLPQVESQASSTPHPLALQRVIAQLKAESPADVVSADDPCDDNADLSFLRPPDRLGLLGYLGAYEVIEVIATGGMGIVLKAHDPALGRVVAIKVLSPRLATSASARRRFLREGRAAAAVCDDHIVTIHGVDETAGLPFLVMKHIVGESLQDRLDRLGALPIAEVVRIGLETAMGLAAAHAHRLIHRDIKPANLLLENGSGTVIITDFGLARMLDDAQLTRNGVIAGTPAYMAPEQAKGEPVDHRADLFSLGSVLYAMCTGIPPFGASPAVAVLRRLIDESPKPLTSLNPDVPAWLIALIDKLMAKDSARRCQSAAEAAAWLRDGASHQHREVGSRKVKLWLAVGLCACLLLGSLLLAQQLGGPMNQQTKQQAATETYYDFRGQPLPDDLVALGDKECLHVEPEGLRLTLPKDRPRSVDITTLVDAYDTAADFEVTTTFEILKAESPPPSFGVGICLTVKKATSLTGSAAMGRLVRAKDRQVLFWDHALETFLKGKRKIDSGALPCTDNIGRLRLKRTGSTLQQLWAPGRAGGEFKQINQCEFGTDGIRRFIVSGVTGGRPCTLDARIIDLRISAVRESEPDIAVSPLGEGAIFFAPVLAAALAVAFGFALYRQRRARRQPAALRAPVRASAAEAGSPLLMVCAGCGKKLRIRAELAGKKVKCPSCGESMHVPVAQPGEASASS